MSEELSVDQVIRFKAMQMAVSYVTERIGVADIDLISTAKEIYEFIKGENTNG
jgi:hypothetical protein